MRKLKPHLLRILLFTVVLFVTLEIGLQMAAIILPRFLVRSDDPVSGVEGTTILCVGDSHTFGAPLPEEDAYPSQLRRRLNRDPRLPAVRVVNLGIPGQNSAMVANRLEAQIERYRPDLVIVWVGLNNSWNFSEFDLARSEGSDIRWRQWLLHSKVLRLIVVSGFRDTDVSSGRSTTRASGTGGAGVQRWTVDGEVVEIPMAAAGDETPTLDAIQSQRENDYAHMIETARDHGIPIIFVTYPLEILPNQLQTNQVIRGQAERFGVPVVSSRAAYERAIEEGYSGDDLIVDAVGPHPTEILYRYVVDLLEPLVRRKLALPDSRE
ncbi:MAG TPA: hypothetical protein ENI85_18525 [Deltaproteobacteria bacterium]|nr:hypothetical protein [Deltaproteobacteria bacterium]